MSLLETFGWCAFHFFIGGMLSFLSVAAIPGNAKKLTACETYILNALIYVPFLMGIILLSITIYRYNVPQYAWLKWINALPLLLLIFQISFFKRVYRNQKN